MNQLDDLLRFWVIYEKPLDFPNSFVVRQWIVNNGESQPEPGYILAPDLATARAAIPAARYRLPRSERDEPQIVEVWV